jgi:hypothetical protein
MIEVRGSEQTGREQLRGPTKEVSMSHSYRTWIFGLALALGGAACTVDREEPSTSTETSPLVTPYIGQQGRLLMGFRDPDVRTFTFPASYVGLHVGTDGQLVANGYAGAQFVGMPMIGTDGTVNVFMKIANVVNSSAPYETWLYALEQYDFTQSRWVPACADPVQLIPPTTPPEPPLAIAIPGTWTRDGFYLYDANKVSFACRTGVIAKCNGWGYAPTLAWPTVTENGLATPGRGPDLLQACTRMARADYCALGAPNTLDGTPIHLDDIYTQPPEDRAFAFEAAWPGLAVMVTPMIVRPPPPRRLPAICLSKLRWSTLPLGGGCTALPDPRVDSKGVFCDDLPQTTLEAKGALTYSASTFIDAGLYTYLKPSDGTRLTTSNLLPQAAGQPPKWQITQPPGVPFPITGAALPQFEATIFSSNLPPGLPTTNLQKLATYQCGEDLVTEAIGPNAPKGCTFVANEGYLYEPGTPGRAPLRRWYNPSTKRSYTTAASPSTMIPAGWNLTDVVGAVIRATINVNVRWSAIQGASYSLDIQTRTGEWITPCLGPTVIGASSSVIYTGVCTSAAMRKVDHADIQAFRVTATTTVGTTVGTRLYDGIDSDWYINLAGGQTSAVALSWNNVGGGAHYRFDVMRNGLWDKCIDADALGPITSYVHTGFCPALGTTVKLALTQGLRICALWTGHQDEVCAEVPYGGETRAVFDLPAIE